MKNALKTSIALMLSLMMYASAHAQTTLRVSAYLPSSHWLISDAMKEWARQVQEETQGKLKIHIFPTPIGSADQQFANARDGVADITMGAFAFTPGRGILNDVASTVNSGSYSESRGAALWRVLQSSAAMQKEFEGVVPLGVFSTTPMNFFSPSVNIQTVNDFKGLKVHVSNPMTARVATALDMTVVMQPPHAVFELLSGRVVDSAFLTSDGVESFKLERIVKHGLIMPGGTSSGIGFLVMNPAKFKKLSPDLQQKLLKVSGENYARIIGRIWDQRDQRALTALEKSGGQIKHADGQLQTAFMAKAESANTLWLRDVEQQRPGVDGTALLASFREEVAKIESEMRSRANSSSDEAKR